jgi:hypothetical protein
MLLFYRGVISLRLVLTLWTLHDIRLCWRHWSRKPFIKNKYKSLRPPIHYCQPHLCSIPILIILYSSFVSLYPFFRFRDNTWQELQYSRRWNEVRTSVPRNPHQSYRILKKQKNRRQSAKQLCVIAQRIWNIKSDWHNAISQATFVQGKYRHVEQYRRNRSSICRLYGELKIIRKNEVLQMKLTFLTSKNNRFKHLSCIRCEFPLLVWK